MPKGSGASGNPITIDSFGSGSKPSIEGNGILDNDGAVLRLTNQQYWEIKNLDLSNVASTAGPRNGIIVLAKDMGACNHIYIQNCNIHDVTSGRWGNFESTDSTDNYVNNQWQNVGGIVFRE